METLLFLCHRIPYPPNKGDKIRSFNFLKKLSTRYKVILAAFVDDPADLKYRKEIEKYCQEVYLKEIDPKVRKLCSLKGFLSGEALSVAFYRDKEMFDWLKSVAQRETVSVGWVFSSTMAQYLPALKPQRPQVVIDYVDVDSEKWLAYSEKHRWPMSYIYGREGRKLLDFEVDMAGNADHGLFVTRDEAQLFRELAPSVANKIGHVENGVDIDYFDPQLNYENPYPSKQKVLVFTGAMDYWANEEAVSWFVQNVLPLIQQQEPDAHFYIVGARPSAAVNKLAQQHQVHVTGSVVDIRPYLAHAITAVTPLRVARGVQNKVLEAMAMAKPVVATQGAIEGIRATASLRTLVADKPSEFADKVVSLLQGDNAEQFGQEGRQLVVDTYSWSSCLQPLEQILD